MTLQWDVALLVEAFDVTLSRGVASAGAFIAGLVLGVLLGVLAAVSK